MKKYNYKSKKSLFKNMRNVSISLGDKLFISASHQDGLDFSFRGIGNVDNFILDKNCSDEELGETVKLAYEKCTSIYWVFEVLPPKWTWNRVIMPSMVKRV